MRFKSAISGPIAKGKRLATTTMKNKPVKTSVLWRTAKVRSRLMRLQNPFIA
jgi:hypothetical protein